MIETSYYCRNDGAVNRCLSGNVKILMMRGPYDGAVAGALVEAEAKGIIVEDVIVVSGLGGDTDDVLIASLACGRIKGLVDEMGFVVDGMGFVVGGMGLRLWLMG